ncbi:hypothetical protein BDM02DRAFT_3160414 [Thelephora ganbajun]|uniref:Uncharacterized protein n=1 Tax=Thelephora ganbajun TaxID=370292 RepID=A0ACB6ZTI0_THEGA|nr:hypothetical protein BDM02DRAFT_3160414 [Thelephora ganbajun]
MLGTKIKMYLRVCLTGYFFRFLNLRVSQLSIPDTTSPGTPIALFREEENLKILKFKIHPLNQEMVPYSFDESIYPLLNKAARALNLPTRSEQSYLTLFMSHMSMASNIDPSTVLDDRYTGTILVNDYNVCFVTPREIPVIPRDQSSILRTPSTSLHRRRPSVVDRRTLNFMAAIEMWVPYTCIPPNAPFVLSIPTPRCLSNQIRLRIFPPNSSQVSGSYASLSSAEDEITSWDLTSDPPVTRGGMGTTNTHSDMADDESSDSSYPSVGTYPDGCGIQGNFPSTERIRIRWAAPLKPNSTLVTRDGRRQVGIREVSAETQYEILGRHNDGLLVKLDHKAYCKGVWFPGVATMVGLDIKLHSSECDVSWAPGSEPKWNVTGQNGFTGFSVDNPVRLGDYNPTDSPESVATALPNGNVGTSQPRYNESPSSGSSLLRVALPEQIGSDYSFEASTSTMSATVSSMESLEGKSRPSSNGRRNSPRSPLSIITVHLNMDSLLPPSNETAISVSGVVLISSVSSSQESSDENETPTEPFSLPVFRFNGLNTQSMGCVVRNAAEDLVVDVRDSKTRATTLTKGRSTKCSRDGVRIGARSTALTMASRSRTMGQSQPAAASRVVSPPLTQSRTPNLPSLTHVPSTSALRTMAASVRPKRDGQLMIPSVVVHVTPYPSTSSNRPDMYAVMVTLPAPTDSNSEWLEVGLAQSGDPQASGEGPPRVHVVSASVEDVPVRYEVRAGAKEEDTSESTGVPFEQQSGKEWITWISIHVGETGGGQVKIAYLSRIKPLAGRDAEKIDLSFNILLPVFTLPVGQLDVNLEPHSGYQFTIISSSLACRKTMASVQRLTHWGLEAYFYPQTVVKMSPDGQQSRPLIEAPPKSSTSWNVVPALTKFAMWAIPAILFIIYGSYLHSKMGQILRENVILKEASLVTPDPVTTTIFSTFTATTTSVSTTTTTLTLGNKWFFAGDSASEPSEPTHLPWESIIDPPLAYTSTSLVTPSPRPTDSKKSVFEASKDPSPWSSIQLPSKKEMTEHLRWAIVKLWKVVLKVYHYPLDPP